jgi:hypothetical protein
MLLYFFAVVKISAKKNAVDKEQVVKLVDDTYRSVSKTVLIPFSSSNFGMLLINVMAEVL